MALYEGSAAPDDEKRLVVIPGAGHNDLLAVGAATYFEAIRDFVSLPDTFGRNSKSVHFACGG